MQSESTYNWKTDKWSVPVNVAVSKLVKWGKLPVSLQAGQHQALKGAAVGAGVGALVKRKDSRSKGAVTGALVGGVLGGARQSHQTRQDQQARQQWEQQQSNEYAQRRNTCNRAFAACMESKGYTVK